MRWLILAARLAATAVLTGCVMAQGTDKLPLQNSSEFIVERHVILTAPLASDAEALAHAEAVADRAGGEVVSAWPLAAIDRFCYVVRLPAEIGQTEANAIFLRDPNILSAQPMTRFDLSEARYSDDLVPIQDSLRSMNVLAAHHVSTGRGITVALVDSAVDTDHVDLKDQHITYRDLVDPAAPPEVAERHGTAMAGLIAADNANNQGIVGVAPDVRLLALRACWSSAPPTSGPEVCNTFSLARALNFAVLNGADIINLSMGGTRDDLIVQLINAAEARGIVVFAAHGSGPVPRFPASEPSVIAAKTVRPEGDRSAVTAPGRDVLSTEPGNRYDFFSGDSVATAHSVGVAALLMAGDPDLGPAEIRRAFAARPEMAGSSIDACELVQAAVSPGTLSCN